MTLNPDPGVRERVLSIITAHMQTQLDGIAVQVQQDLRGFAQVGTAGCPALFIVTAESGQGETMHEMGKEVRELMSFNLIGYAASSTGTPDGVEAAREQFFRQTMRALYLEDDNEDEILHKALLQDSIANNGGAVDIRHTAPPDTDGGLTPPFGVFSLPCVVLLHYRRSSF